MSLLDQVIGSTHTRRMLNRELIDQINKDAAAVQRDHVCAECGSGLVMPYDSDLGHSRVECHADPSHNHWKLKNTRTKTVAGIEVDIMTGQELAARTATIDSAVRVEQAKAAGLFQKDATPEQLDFITRAAVAYQLDPLMQEIILYQGKPFITIMGRRRLDERAGHKPSLGFRPYSPAELEACVSMGILQQGDMAAICYLEEDGRTIEGHATIRKAEIEEQRTSRNGDKYFAAPVLRSNTLEMLYKRAESRARAQAYGPAPRPEGYESIRFIDEDTIEGQVRELPANEPKAVQAPEKPRPKQSPQKPSQTKPTNPDAKMAEDAPDYGRCPVHNAAWKPKSDTGELGHPLIEGGNCFKADIDDTIDEQAAELF